MKRDDWFRYSRHVLKSRRWPGLRLAAKRRDGFKCVHCGERGRLEVDHRFPVRDAPELAFDLDNLQTLCRSCHARKTRSECAPAALSPRRQRWRDLLQTSQEQEHDNA